MANYAKNYQNSKLESVSSDSNSLGPPLLYFTAKRKILKHEEIFVPYGNHQSKQYDEDFSKRRNARKQYFKLKELATLQKLEPERYNELSAEIEKAKNLLMKEDLPGFLSDMSDMEDEEEEVNESKKPEIEKSEKEIRIGKLVDPAEHGLCVDSILEEGEVSLDHIDVNNLQIPIAQSYMSEVMDSLEEGEIPRAHLKNIIQELSSSGKFTEPNRFASSLFAIE